VPVYDAVFLDKLTRHQLTERLADLLVLTTLQLDSIYTRGPPANINVDVTDNVSVNYYPATTRSAGVARNNSQWRCLESKASRAWDVGRVRKYLKYNLQIVKVVVHF